MAQVLRKIIRFRVILGSDRVQHSIIASCLWTAGRLTFVYTIRILAAVANPSIPSYSFILVHMTLAVGSVLPSSHSIVVIYFQSSAGPFCTPAQTVHWILWARILSGETVCPWNFLGALGNKLPHENWSVFSLKFDTFRIQHFSPDNLNINPSYFGDTWTTKIISNEPALIPYSRFDFIFLQTFQMEISSFSL